MKRKLNLKLHTDPGHGWIEVKSIVLVQLGITKDITPYSYSGDYGQTAYLEEDCDAGTLIKALKDQIDGLELSFTEIHSDSDSFIRSLPSY